VKLLVLLAVFPALPALAEPAPKDVEKIMQRDLRARGQATMDRVAQDGLQRVCTESNDRPPAELVKQLEADQMKTIAFPASGLLGDWKKGEQIAQSGRGMTFTDKPGENGGSCYNCHQLAASEISYGTLGPSLLRFGKQRGNTPEMQKYVYGKIYNSKAYSACSQMPRLGYSGTLSEQQIKDLTAYLLDPASPVNQ
jgi:L-cysteine S-thiosulfotransferase